MSSSEIDDINKAMKGEDPDTISIIGTGDPTSELARFVQRDLTGLVLKDVTGRVYTGVGNSFIEIGTEQELVSSARCLSDLIITATMIQAERVGVEVKAQAVGAGGEMLATTVITVGNHKYTCTITKRV